MKAKAELRRTMRKTRREHAAAIPDGVRALLFKRPPADLLAMIAADSVIGLYHATADEAPCGGYARYFIDEGYAIALPRLAAGAARGRMDFAAHTDPLALGNLVDGPHGIRQPAADLPILTPDVLFVPMVAFTDDGQRLGQGGGYYDAWLAAHPGTTAIGMGWDCQMVDTLPLEPHDMPMTAVVTPTRLYGPF